MFKSQTSTRDETISSLQTELKALETMLEEQNQNKADLEYSLRASEYNVEILKNQLENVNTEHQLLNKQSEKQQKQVQALRQITQTLKHDIAFYKKGKRPPPQPKFDFN